MDWKKRKKLSSDCSPLFLFSSLFGKMIESNEKKMEARFCFEPKQAERRHTDPRYKGSKIVRDDFSIAFFKKKVVRSYQLWAIGFSILDLSKMIMQVGFAQHKKESSLFSPLFPSFFFLRNCTTRKSSPLSTTSVLFCLETQIPSCWSLEPLQRVKWFESCMLSWTRQTIQSLMCSTGETGKM